MEIIITGEKNKKTMEIAMQGGVWWVIYARKMHEGGNWKEGTHLRGGWVEQQIDRDWIWNTKWLRESISHLTSSLPFRFCFYEVIVFWSLLCLWLSPCNPTHKFYFVWRVSNVFAFLFCQKNSDFFAILCNFKLENNFFPSSFHLSIEVYIV